jgi:hypothetical protein
VGDGEAGRVALAHLSCRRDPRLTEHTDADLQEQFKLAVEIRDALSRAHEGVIRIW